MEDLITTARAADLLGCSIGTIRNMAADGQLEVVLRGDGITGARFYRRADVLALAETKRAALEAKLADLPEPA